MDKVDLIARIGAFAALCGILFCFGYVGSATDWLHRAWGIYGILMGSIAFFYLSGIWEREDDDYDD